MDACRDGVDGCPGGLAYTGGWREKTSIILLMNVCSCLSCHHSCATVILPPGSTSRPLRTPMSLVGTTNAIGGACGYSCGSHTATGIWYVLPLYGVGSVPWSCSSNDVWPESNADVSYTGASQLTEGICPDCEGTVFPEDIEDLCEDAIPRGVWPENGLEPVSGGVEGHGRGDEKKTMRCKGDTR